MITLKQTRQALSGWGKVAFEQRIGDGFSSKSPTERLRESMLLGYCISGTEHQINHTSDGVFMPEWAQLVELAIQRLWHPEERVVLVKRYCHNAFNDRKEKMKGLNLEHKGLLLRAEVGVMRELEALNYQP
ncbi:hypothetical protein [Ferrimonas aestuarii]|uniref:Phage antitermination protein Q n=1 Tax=Ferrimonas aestuarii TaxID=2569539 RepID=A0A4U1BQA0_9GAMM|nr:hypothetical protein [Ferrimonas aestuarii]TKB53293.1 hypothetical protein FCL42_14570 [Ferrimonas aestuarii]